jgi:hypothetical protein
VDVVDQAHGLVHGPACGPRQRGSPEHGHCRRWLAAVDEITECEPASWHLVVSRGRRQVVLSLTCGPPGDFQFH